LTDFVDATSPSMDRKPSEAPEHQKSRRRFTMNKLLAVLVAAAAVVPIGTTAQSIGEKETVLQVEHALQRLPYYGVFDFLGFSVDRGVVTVGGFAYRTTLKDDATAAIKRVPGVDEVANKIEELPVSPNDDRIRWATFYRIYTDDFLSRYGTPVPGFNGLRAGRRYWGRTFGSWPGFRTGMWGRAPFLGMEPLGNYGIHIIVRGGNVALFGTVSNEADKTKAGLEARDVLGVHNVDNEIQIVGE